MTVYHREHSLTPFQYEIWNHLKSASLTENPFLSDGNVILAGATSSGKTLVSEMFMVNTALSSHDRSRAIYIAPTRVLAQTKWAEINEKYGQFFSDAPLILSTGEDFIDDWRIPRGDFSIACMVYEKANLVFSRRRGLINNIGCLVIDEMHMLNDQDRGPVLELLIAKIISKRKSLEGEDHLPRMIGITTERATIGDPLYDLFKVTGRGGMKGDMPPFMFQSPCRPVTINHYLSATTKDKSVKAGSEGRGDA
jgi:replicative superfamily II helicase